MDRRDTILLITEKIKALEPENASIFIDYLLLQEMTKAELIRMALGPDLLIQEFCQKAKSELGYLPSKGSSLNPNARPFNTNDQSLSQSSGRNQFLYLSRTPNIPNSNSSLFHGGSSQFPFPYDKNPFPNLQTRSFWANDARLESEQHRYWFLPNGFGTPGGFVSPSEEISQPQQRRMIAARGSPMSNIQGWGQFGVEGGNSYSPGRHEREDFNSRNIYLTFTPESSFTNEDVSTYFSNFGPVVDVRIPYQQQRMYGFVTFATAETVITVLAEENPHLIGDSIVFVKPYKEKVQKQGSGQFGVEGAYVSPSENTAQPQQQRVIAASGSPMSNIQGSGQFQVEGGFSPGSDEREDINSRKIYLTFPPYSSFTNENVSTYFSKFGPVVDVTIPYQQQRMFGFVTFAEAETVKTILAQANPHYLNPQYMRKSRVTVKPFMEKAEILQKEQQQQLDQLLERGNYSPSSSSSG